MQQRKTVTFTYNLIRAKRKTMSLRVSEDGAIEVRAPYRTAVATVDQFVEDHKDWIRRQLAVSEKVRMLRPSYTEKEREDGKKRARAAIAAKCRFYAARMGVTYGTISIREQKTRWGSCSSKGNLNFNWKLVLMPEEILDYVVVHELAHRREMNHGPAFWKIVESVLPDYRARKEWLRKNGKLY